MRKTLLAVVTGLVLLAPVAMPWDSELSSAPIMVAWAADSPAGECILKCFDWAVGCAEDTHIAKREGDTHQYGNGWHDDCWPETCDDQHPQCAVGLAAMNEVKRAILHGASRAEYHAIAARHTANIMVDGEALSLFDCAGELIGHFPLTALVTE